MAAIHAQISTMVPNGFGLDHWESHRIYPGNAIPWSCKAGPGELAGEAGDRDLDLASRS